MGGDCKRRSPHSTTGEIVDTEVENLLSDLISDDEERAIAAVDALSVLGVKVLPSLLELLRDPDPNRRWWAIRAMATIPDPKVPLHLRNALCDPDYTVRQCAALGLSQQPNVDSIPDLIKTLDDKDRLVARLAADALIAIDGPAVMDLIHTLETGSQPSRIESARALAVIGDTRAIPAMFDAWENGSALIRHWIEHGFERMGVGMQFFQPE